MGTRGGIQKGRQAYIEVKWITEEWWFILLWIWFAISATTVTLAIRYNILHGWNCPRHCGAFLTPFGISLMFLFLACCLCCPILGSRGVWWCVWKRKTDQPKRQLHRVTKKCCCLACSWSADVKMEAKRIGKKIIEIDAFDPTGDMTYEDLYEQTRLRVDAKREREAREEEGESAASHAGPANQNAAYDVEGGYAAAAAAAAGGGGYAAAAAGGYAAAAAGRNAPTTPRMPPPIAGWQAPQSPNRGGFDAGQPRNDYPQSMDRYGNSQGDQLGLLTATSTVTASGAM